MTISSVNGIPWASIASINGVPVGSMTSINGVAVPSGGTVPNAPTNLRLDGVFGDKVAQFTGVSGDYFSTPDSPAVSVTGDLELRAVISLNQQNSPRIASKQNLDRAWNWFLGSTGQQRLQLSSDGNPGPTAGATSGSLSLHEKVELRVVFNASAGSADFYRRYSDADGWIQETDGGEVMPNSIKDTTDIVELGSILDGTTSLLDGDIHRFQMWDGHADSGGTLVAEFNSTQSPTYGTGASWDSWNTGETWTGQGDARLSAVNTLVVDSFTDVNGTLVSAHTPDVDVEGAGWSIVAGSDWTIESDELQQADPTLSAGAYVIIDPGSIDFSIELYNRTSVGKGRNVGLYANTDSAFTEYTAVQVLNDAGNNELKVRERISGSGGVDRAVATIPNDQEQNIQFVRSEGVLTGVVNGVSASYSPAGTTLNLTELMLYRYKATVGSDTDTTLWFDDLKVTSITDLPL
jgi:hypothetical protein